MAADSGSTNHALSGPVTSNGFFAVAVALYVAANLIGRWLQWVIFHAHGSMGFGFSEPTLLQWTAMILGSCLSLAAIAVAVTLCSRAHPIGIWAALLLVWCLLLAAELDFSWYAISREHVRWHDIMTFVTESWRDHLGIQRSDLMRFAVRAAAHLFVLLALLAVARTRPVVTRAHRWRRLSASTLLLLLLVFIGLQKGSVVYARVNGNAHWLVVSQMNLFYPEFQDERLEQYFLRINERVGSVNTALMENFEPLPQAAPISEAPPPDKLNVLLISAEGWNQSFLTPAVMPYTAALATRCHRGQRHYSTGNLTSHGVIGLLSGDPLTAIRSFANIGHSRYVDRFNAWGYRTVQVGGKLTADKKLARYLSNFSEPSINGSSDWENLEAIRDRLQRPGPDFVYAHYWNTHFPYQHADRFARFQPEVPEDFDFGRPDITEQRDAITNRYRNTLVELDAWLEKLLSQVDLSQTIVVIAGDHGEEMFETGRLSHASTVEDPQVRTPLLICEPHPDTRTVRKTLSSHADVMPSVMAILGVQPHSLLGRSIFEPAQTPVIVSMNNHRRPPVRWRVISPAASAEFKAPYRERVTLMSYAVDDGTDVDTELLRMGRMLQAGLPSEEQYAAAADQ
ncbi:MAG TPA: sulfatase-like hydrolase/transferase [Povalibacter sp.]|nr:sulfatase-like hydrolase/transferase [Povalibacter sp.]